MTGRYLAKVYHATPSRNIPGIMRNGLRGPVYFATSMEIIMDYINQERHHEDPKHRKDCDDWIVLEIKRDVDDYFNFEWKADPDWGIPGEYYTESSIPPNFLRVHSRIRIDGE